MGVTEVVDKIAWVLPRCFREALYDIPTNIRSEIEEIRLRQERPVSILLPKGEYILENTQTTETELRDVIERATQGSAHTALDQIKNGFITMKGGHRIGLCGTVVRRDDRTVTMRYLSSLSIRVAREIVGQAERIAKELASGQGMIESTLLLGPPGSGKTTLLRDLIRVISDGIGVQQHRVSVADERGELAALWYGKPQFDIGMHTDVLDGCPKAEAMISLLRGMNPQVLAVDEITHPNDINAISEVCGCGVALLATAHCRDISDLYSRPLYKKLINEHVFGRAVVIGISNGNRVIRVEDIPE